MGGGHSIPAGKRGYNLCMTGATYITEGSFGDAGAVLPECHYVPRSRRAPRRIF